MVRPSLIVMMAALIAAPAMAQPAACARPDLPAAVDGSGASLDQMVAAKAAIGAFQTASDAYQECLLADVEAQKAAAKAAKTKFDPAIAKAANAKINENQGDKVKAADAYNAAVKAFKAAHPA